MRNTVFRYTEIQITRIKKYKISALQKYNTQIYRNATYIFTEIHITEIQNTKYKKYKWQDDRNTSDF